MPQFEVVSIPTETPIPQQGKRFEVVSMPSQPSQVSYPDDQVDYFGAGTKLEEEKALPQENLVGFAKMVPESLLHGATLGLSSVAEEAALGNAQERIAREEAFPVSSAVLKGVGAIGGMFLGSGEASLAAKAITSPIMLSQAVGRLAEQSIGKTFAAKFAPALAMGVTGALEAGVSSFADSFSKDLSLDAEKLLAYGKEAGVSSLWGGATGTAVPLAFMGIKKAASKLAGSTIIEDAVRKAYEKNKVQYIPDDKLTLVQKMQKGYLMSERDPSKFVNQMTEALEDYAKAYRNGANIMYEEVGAPLQKIALANMSTKQAMTNAQELYYDFEKILKANKDKYRPRSYKKIESMLDDATMFTNSDDASSVFTKLRRFATKLDTEIKFDSSDGKILSDQWDEFKHMYDLRDLIRGRMEDPNIWGKAADLYKSQNKTFAPAKEAFKQFEKDFITTRDGKDIVDVRKVKSFLAKTGDISQEPIADSLSNFITHATNMGTFTENNSYLQGVQKDFLKTMVQAEAKAKTALEKAKINNIMYKAKSGSKFDLSDYASVETLGDLFGDKAKAAILPYMYFAGEGGGYRAGTDLRIMGQYANSLGQAVENTTTKIDKGINSIFLGK